MKDIDIAYGLFESIGQKAILYDGCYACWWRIEISERIKNDKV